MFLVAVTKNSCRTCVLTRPFPASHKWPYAHRGDAPAGYAETTALKKQSEKLGKVGRYIAELMEQKGLTDDRLLDVLENGLRAMKVISANMVSMGSDESPEGHGMIRGIISVDDYATRHRYLETGLRLRGYFNRTDHTVSNPDGSNVFDVGVMLGAIKGKTRGLPSNDED